MTVMKLEALNPTLWRTCRVLANKKRLLVLRELGLRPEQRVSGIAHRLGLSPSLASQALRALNARGLLRARRVGKYVYYIPGANRSIPNSDRLLQVIQKEFANDKKPSINIFQYCTAFTHPRRILIIKTLCNDPMQLKDIAFKTKIPTSALDRHLRKLIDRGFVSHADGRYACSVPRNQFARVLLHFAKHA